jgi:hypothetical protein
MRVSRLVLPLALLVMANAPLRGQDTTATPSAGAIAAATQLLQLMNLESVMRATTSATFAAQVKQQPAMAPFRDVMQAWADSTMTLKAMGPALVRIYAQTFSEAELRQLVAFYQTPVGRKLATVSPELTRRGAEVGAAVAEANMPMLQRMIQARAAQLPR